jgi:hypothetical protein
MDSFVFTLHRDAPKGKVEDLGHPTPTNWILGVKELWCDAEGCAARQVSLGFF